VGSPEDYIVATSQNGIRDSQLESSIEAESCHQQENIPFGPNGSIGVDVLYPSH
jgi:hypothetical protein